MKRLGGLVVLLLMAVVLSGCGVLGQKEQAAEPDANEVFQRMYSVVTLAVSANGQQEKFRWKNNSRPFPFEEASWADVTVFSCDEGTSNLELKATTYGQNLGTEDYLGQVEKVRGVWESRGLTVRNVGGSRGMFQIATDLEDGTTVVYTAGVGGESVEASTECFAGFMGDESSAKTFPAEKG